VRVRIIVASVATVDPLDIGPGADGREPPVGIDLVVAPKGRIVPMTTMMTSAGMAATPTVAVMMDVAVAPMTEPTMTIVILPLTIAVLATILPMAATPTAVVPVIAHPCDIILDGSQCFERCPKSAVRVRRA